MTSDILLIDDDESLNRVISYQLSEMGFQVTTAVKGEEGLRLFREKDFDIVISDVQLPDINGMEVLNAVRLLDRDVVFIIITAYGTVDNAIEAGQLGADEYLTKPFGKEALRFVIEKAMRLRELKAENVQLRGELYQKYNFDNLIGKSAAWTDVLKLTGRVAESDATILIQGESGTGKELIARAIHYNSLRKEKPFVTVNCPSIPENLMESELFGHVRGAFTGANKDRTGKFEMADQGTIFLDEIGDMRSDLQAKLLRVLQEKEIERVGDSKPRRVDARVVAATNKDIEALVSTGIFREDLYYRLNVVTIPLPPLRDRREDIPFLVDYFVSKYAKGEKYSVSEKAMTFLIDYDWPGNVRELENAIERAIVIATSTVITPEELPPMLKHVTQGILRPAAAGDPDRSLTLADLERRAIVDALDKSGGNQTKAAKLLDIPRHVLIYRMKKLRIKA
ncbi:MAG: sigma-54 dependent transcriptional regulator [candidate division KSB1 bacterium]|jgi:two-component system NtrC family response regulator|nr:sigma-54 dependent transcriptional regulator [candidate division KSB1 bacterium]